MENCKNCYTTLNGNFCSNCGQKTSTKRLDWSYVFDELKYTFLHLNGGLLFTCKQLLTRPGDMAREFIEGKRVKHYKPILLVFVLAGISTILMHYNGDLKLLEKMTPSDNKSVFDPKEYAAFFGKYNTYIQLLSIPLVSLCTWLAFKKWGYNYIENIIINSFVISQLLLLGILAFPIKYFFSENPLISVSTAVSIIFYGFSIWLYLRLYRGKPKRKIVLRMLLTLALLLVIFVALVIIGVIVGVIYAVVTKGSL